MQGPVKTRRAITVLCLVGCAWVSVGCTAQYSQPGSIFVPKIQPELAFRNAIDVLQDMHFSIDKVDPNSGAIKTRPLPGGQCFELWRADNVTLADHIESNLQTIARTAWVAVSPYQSGVRIECLVLKQRIFLDRPRVNTHIDAYRNVLYPLVTSSQAEWIDVGPDPMLAKRILTRIEHQLKRYSGGNR